MNERQHQPPGLETGPGMIRVLNLLGDIPDRQLVDMLQQLESQYGTINPRNPEENTKND